MKSKLDLQFTEQALKDIQRLDTVTLKRLAKKLKYYQNLPSPLTPAEPLVDSKIGTYRWRVGDYRIIFDIEKTTIYILRVRHRREVYRDI